MLKEGGKRESKKVAMWERGADFWEGGRPQGKEHTTLRVRMAFSLQAGRKQGLDPATAKNWILRTTQMKEDMLCVCVPVVSHVRLFAIFWTIAHQAPLLWDLPIKNTGVGCHFLLQGIFQPRVGTHISCVSWTEGRFFTHWAIDKAPQRHRFFPKVSRN